MAAILEWLAFTRSSCVVQLLVAGCVPLWKVMLSTVADAASYMPRMGRQCTHRQEVGLCTASC